MSKSIGNVIDPFELVKTYGVDNVRYFLASEINFGNDGDFSQIAFQKKINELADDIGNLLQRILVLIHKNFDGKVPPIGTLNLEEEEFLRTAREMKAKITIEQLNEFNIKGICDNALSICRYGNKYIHDAEPWKVVKTDKNRAGTILYVLFESLRIAGIYFEPIIPNSTKKLFEQMRISPDYSTLQSIDSPYPSGLPIGKPAILFPKFQEKNKK